MQTERETRDILRGKRIAFIGCGVMAEAITSVLLRSELVSPSQLIGSEPVEARRQEFARRYDIRCINDNREVTLGADLVLLSIKPQSLEDVMSDLAGVLTPGQVVVSIIPGATLDRLTSGLRHDAVVRSMPNTPAQIGYGATVWHAAPAVSDEGRDLATAVLGAMGVAVRVDSEDAVDMATALSGTGPAYIFMVMEALVDAGVHMGFSRRTAEDLVHQTMLGSVLFARESGRHPAELRNMVTTPGGTTASALYEMEKGGLRTVIARSVWAAFRRAQELGGTNKASSGPSDFD